MGNLSSAESELSEAHIDRHPACVAPGLSLRFAFRVEIHRDRLLTEPALIVQGVDDDDRPRVDISGDCIVPGDCIVLAGDCGDVDTALPADQ
jgi:hypothetical protein